MTGKAIVSRPRGVVPGPAVVPGLVADRSNNNLDVVDHGGRRFLAWRTAPSHFAGPLARIHVVSSDDLGTTWRRETTVALGRDVREPRLVSWGDRLLLYAFEAGTDPRRFQPGRGLVVERDGRGWGPLRWVTEPGCVVWRVRVVGGRAVMSLYRGADTLYTAHPEALRVELRVSDDGVGWVPLDPDRPVLHHGGTETELAVWQGRVHYVCRKEGPDGGWGTDVGSAPLDDPLEVAWRSFPAKADSPLLVPTPSGLWLVCRRQTAFGGRFDLGWRLGSPLARTRAYQGIYSLTRKRTGVFDVAGGGLDHVTDVPGWGDTAFAAAVAADGGDATATDRLTLYNYTSPLDGWDRPWLAGQLGPTGIVACDLALGAAAVAPAGTGGISPAAP